MTSRFPIGICKPSNPLALIGYLILVAGITLAFVFTYRQGQENEKAVKALCVLRDDLERRIGSTAKLLRENPGDIFGIPRALIVSSRDNQQQTVDALAVLTCPPKEIP